MFEKLLAIFKLDEASKNRRYANKRVKDLPTCTSKIVVGGTPYDATHYNCEIETTPEELLQYIKSEIHKTATPCKQQLILLAYLPKVNLANPETTYLHPYLIKRIIDIEELITQGLARVKCDKCDETFSYLRKDSVNRVQQGNRISWTEIWECPEGHVIYREDQVMRIIPSGTR